MIKKTMMKPLGRIIGYDTLGIVLFILIVGFSIISLPTTIAMVEKQAYEPMQETASWQILSHPFSNENSIFWDVHFINSTHGWVVGQNKTGLGSGIILNTKDCGDSWQLQLYEDSHMFRSIDIIDSQTIWVTDTGGLVYSTDGGQTWNESTVISENAGLGAVTFINKTHGWTSTMNDVYKTVDGGQTWQNVTSWTFSDSLRMIHFISPTEAWAIGIFGIYHTEDTCETWEESFNHGGWSLSFVSATEAWAVADSWLAHMTDGKTWIEQPVPRNSLFPRSESPYFTDISFLDSENGWIAGDETEIAYTPNGGIDWYSQNFPSDTRVIAIDFINLTHGWAVGWGGNIYRTIHGNNLGTHLWTGMSGLTIIVLISMPTAFLIVFCVVFLIRRKKRKTLVSTTDANIELR
jgi:photosystem II stability/assembly factor-like uncharacterized protein